MKLGMLTSHYTKRHILRLFILFYFHYTKEEEVRHHEAHGNETKQTKQNKTKQNNI
jgi:hypothetical protein